MACSSPKLVLWVGPEPTAASSRFWIALGKTVRRKQYTLEPAIRIQKLTTAAGLAMQGLGSSYHEYNGVSVFTLRDLAAFPRQECGGGFFAEVFTPSLGALRSWICRRDQTLVQFGFSPMELADLASQLAGRGVDRIVSPGEALSFNRYWDGYDMLAEFSRYVTLPSNPQ
jgi:hypothetical protein